MPGWLVCDTQALLPEKATSIAREALDGMVHSHGFADPTRTKRTSLVRLVGTAGSSFDQGVKEDPNPGMDSAELFELLLGFLRLRRIGILLHKPFKQDVCRSGIPNLLECGSLFQQSLRHATSVGEAIQHLLIRFNGRLILLFRVMALSDVEKSTLGFVRFGVLVQEA